MLLDTSGLLCLLLRSEPNHAAARECYQRATVRLTHSLILAEFVALAQARRLPRKDALVFVHGVLENPDIEIVWVEQALMQESLDLLEARADKTYSWCDAVSFVLMKARGLTEALSTDRHFEQEGYSRLLG
jgi:uncharacterized protein